MKRNVIPAQAGIQQEEPFSMKCTKCRHENPEGAKFCIECSAPMEFLCPHCGAKTPSFGKFCMECAHPLQDRKVVPSAGKTHPQSNTPKFLAEKILQTRSALEGERKQVTVLFADVKGSMDLAEQVDPEEWHRILDRFFQILADGVHRFEGTINQYTGDGIMALFGAPIAHEDHAHRACYASLYLSDQLRRYANELRLSKGLNFAVRMGLNSGQVVVGKIGDDLRMDYTAQGHTVGLAARMEQIAEPGKVYLAQDTAKAVEGYFVLEDLGEVRVPGMGQPVRVSELRGVGMLRTRLEVSRARGFSRFVGRAEEMQALEAALARTRERQAQVVGVVGEAGCGKSRLCYEFLERCRARGLATLEAHGVAHGKATPLVPILQLYRNYYGISDQDSDRPAREKIAGRLLLLEEAFREALPLQFEFLGVADPEQPAPRMDPEARQRQLFAVMKRVIQRTGQQQVTVTLLEDLHWFDGGSLAFVEQFVDAVQGTRVLLVVTFRPEFHAGWMQKSYYQQVPLMPLGGEAIRELLDDLLGTDPSLAGLAARIQERTAGNPFFIEEVVQSLVESGQLEGTRGAYRLTRQVAEISVPDTVQAVLSARIDRQGEREKQVLQMAAVIGKTFSEGVLARIAELDLRASLEALKSAEFIYESSIYPQLEYSFKHPLTQEVAYGSQLGERRQTVHAAVARSLAEMDSERLDERAALIAHHWEAAGEALEAARWHRRAAEWIGRNDVAQATRHWQRVLALTAELPESEERTGLRLSACTFVFMQGGWRLGLSGEDREALFVEARALAERAGDNDAVLNLICGHAIWVGFAGDVRRLYAVHREAHDLVDGCTRPAVHGNMLVGRVYSSFLVGRIDEALRLAEEIPDLVGDDLHLGLDLAGHSLLAWSWHIRTFLSAHRGRLDDACACQREAERLARAGDVGEALVWIRMNPVVIGSMAGERDERVLEQVRHSAFEALGLAEQIGSSYSRVYCHLWAATVRTLQGEWDDAVRACETALQIAKEHQTGLDLEPEILSHLAQARLGAGDLQAAQAAVTEGIRCARERGQLYFEALGHLTRARVLRHARGADAYKEIEQALDRALELVEETNGRSIEPQIVEERARLAELLGDGAAWERLLRDAHRLYTEIGASGHAQRLATELGL